MSTLPVQAVLQAGGRGQRFGSYTDEIPKPLIPVGGMPMIERLVRQIAKCGITEFTIITGYHGEMVEQHLSGLEGLPGEARFRFVREEKPLGNFGAMAGLGGAATLLFVFADLVTDMDFSRFVSVHVGNEASITLASHIESYQVSLGEIVTVGTRVTAYHEKPVKDFTICSGMAVLEPASLSVLEAGEPCGISDFANRAIASGYRVDHWIHEAVFLDVNNAERLETASKIFASDRQGGLS